LVHLILKTKIGRIDAERVKRFAGKVLSVLNISGAEVNFVFTGDREIRRFNRKFLRRDRPTDVLAFGGGKGYTRNTSPRFLGDVMISVDRAKIHARRFRSTVGAELELYIVHGVLHLLGYDDRMAKERRRMCTKEKQVLARVHAARIRL